MGPYLSLERAEVIRIVDERIRRVLQIIETRYPLIRTSVADVLRAMDLDRGNDGSNTR
jgi:hypothetical protein